MDSTAMPRNHRHLPAKRGQVSAWIRLLLVMTVPVLWLLAGISSFR
jgi:hypothetical protein